MIKVTLVPADPSHAEIYFQYRQDVTTQKYNPLKAATFEEVKRRLLDGCSDLSQYGKAEAFFWFVKCDGEIVGTVTLQEINTEMGTAEIGYGVFPGARGRGIASAAVKALTSRVFAETPTRKLTAFVHEDNRASRRIMEKSGYRAEGLLREHFIVQGKPVNEVLYGILRTEFVLQSKLNAT